MPNYFEQNMETIRRQLHAAQIIDDKEEVARLENELEFLEALNNL